MKNINIIDEVKNLFYGFLFITGLLFFIYYFKFSTWERISFLCFINICFLIHSSIKSKTSFKNFLWNALKNCLFIILLVCLLKFVGLFGRMGYLLSILIICSFIIVRKWAKYIQVKQHIEKLLWGKPLNEFVKDKEKPPRIKLKL